jgi:hypothetical protein
MSQLATEARWEYSGPHNAGARESLVQHFSAYYIDEVRGARVCLLVVCNILPSCHCVAASLDHRRSAAPAAPAHSPERMSQEHLTASVF